MFDVTGIIDGIENLFVWFSILAIVGFVVEVATWSHVRHEVQKRLDSIGRE